MALLVVGDFETINVRDNLQVYSWALYDGNDYKYGISIETFFYEIMKYESDVDIYFHNGANFDFHFIVAQLEKYGYRQQAFKENKKVIKKIKKSQFRESNTKEIVGQLEPYEYSVFADDSKLIYSLRIGLDTVHKRHERFNRICFKDSARLFPNSLKGYGEVLNKHYGLDKEKGQYAKKELDGGYTRKTLYSSIEELENDGNELEYLKHDVYILYEYLKLMEQFFPRMHWKLTSASTSYHEWLRNCDNILEWGIEMGLVTKELSPKSTKNKPFYWYRLGRQKPTTSTKVAKKLISDKVLPTKWLNNEAYGQVMSMYMYEWYKGGITQVNPDYMGLVLTDDVMNVMVADINSSYPSSMRHEMLPIGHPYIGDKSGYDFKLLEIEMESDVVVEKGMPFIGIKTGTRLIYPKIIPKGTIINITNIEYERFQKYYSGKWHKVVKFSFMTVHGSYLFGDYIDKNYEFKNTMKTENPALYELSKLKLNTPYGKFGSKVVKGEAIWTGDSWEVTENLNKAEFYLPLGIAITAHSRMKLVDAIGENYKYFIYCDTDSLFVREDKAHLFDMELNPKKLGAWDIEMTGGRGVVRRAKQYFFEYDKDDCYGIKSAFAGIRFGKDDLEYIHNNVHEMIYGLSVGGQLRPNKCEHGVFLEEVEKVIRPIWEFEPIPDQWFDSEKSYHENYERQLNYVANL